MQIFITISWDNSLSRLLLFFLFLIILPISNILAAETCPSGYSTISETDVYVSLSGSCPSGHTRVQTAMELDNCIGALAFGAKTCTYFAVECQVGKYFNGSSYLPCDSGMYCPGTGTAEPGVIGCYDMCPDGYESSDIGSSTNTQCYKSCELSEHATSMTGKDYYGSGIDSCTVSQCQNGYRVDNGICIENTINISWDQGYGDGDNIISNTCSYDGEITMPEEPTRPGYTFTGWKILVN